MILELQLIHVLLIEFSRRFSSYWTYRFLLASSLLSSSLSLSFSFFGLFFLFHRGVARRERPRLNPRLQPLTRSCNRIHDMRRDCISTPNLCTYYFRFVYISCYTLFLAHMSWKSDRLLSVVRPSARLFVNFSHFHLLLKNHCANFNQTKHIASLGDGIQVCSNEGPRSFPRGDNYEIAKIHYRNLKICSRTIGPISIKLCTKHPWVKEIQVCSNEGPPFPGGDNNKMAKIHWRNFKFSSREPLDQFQSNVAQSILWWRDSSSFKWRALPLYKG